LVLVFGAVHTFAKDNTTLPCPRTTEFDGHIVRYTSEYTYETTNSDGVKVTQLMCVYQLAEGTISLRAEDARFPVEKSSTEAHWKEIIVTDGYFRDNEGKIVHTKNFVPYRGRVLDIPVEPQYLNVELTPLFSNVSAIYCGSECMAVSTSQGDEKKHQAALLKMKFYLLMADGTFIELAVSPLPPPACHVRGVHFAKEGNLDLIYIHITDTDDLDKVSIWVVTDKKVTNLNLMPYVADRYNYEANAISASGLGAVSGDQWVNVYDRNNKLIGQAIPCAVS
jgi:hypothetical protein